MHTALADLGALHLCQMFAVESLALSQAETKKNFVTQAEQTIFFFTHNGQV